MAERAIKERQFAYANNASQVLQADRERPRDRNVPTGAAESLAGRVLPKMGDRAVVESEELKKRQERKEQQKRERPISGSAVQKRRRTGLSVSSAVKSVLSVDEYSSHIYKPKTPNTEVRYASLLELVTKHYPDESGEIIADIANELLLILKSEEMKGKQERCEEILGKLNEREFGSLVEISKDITDFEQDGKEGVKTEEEENIVTFDMDVESDENMLDEVDSEEESEGEDANPSDAAAIANAKEEMEEEEGSLRVEDIDSFWLQRQIHEYEQDAEKSQAIAEEVLSILQNSDERGDEDRLVELIGVEHASLIQVLLANRSKIAFVTRWRRATSDQEREAIAAEMMSDPSINGEVILKRLEGGRSTSAWRTTADNLRPNRGEAPRLKAHSEKEDEAALLEEEHEALSQEVRVPKPRMQLDLHSLEFSAGGHLMSRNAVHLPEGTNKIVKPGREEIHVPAAANKYSDRGFLNSHRMVSVEEMPEWFRPGFEGISKLNLIQSDVYECAMLSSENLLLCAPTGAGKTNVALMTILHEMWMHRREDGSVDKDKFKMVYVAPMKALVKEMVDSFSRRLKPYDIAVRELSGDVNLTKEEISKTQLIITTPEKWDIITRKSGDRTYTQLVRLIIVDEIHLLHDDRGPVLEALVARTVRQVETTQEMVRLVGLSATLPNYEDVANFLRVDPKKGLFHFDSSYRPVGLSQQFVGITEKSSFKRMKLMNEICYEKVMEKAGKKQVLVFVHSRKETARTAQYLLDTAVEKDEHHLFFSSEMARKKLEDEMKKYAIKNEDLKRLLPTGFAIHHAGLCRSDRTAVEEMFKQGFIQVLVSTMTLAWGVNLPAHTVIIKGTQMYSPERSAWVELSPQDVLQMLGRAGRPQYETVGEGIIITRISELQYYLSLMNAQLPIESQFIKRLSDNLNAEIVMGTIQNVSDAVSWLGYTYLFIRMLRNPMLYGVDAKSLREDPTLLQYRVDLIHSAATVLAKNALIKYDVKAGLFESTGLGRIASYYYITNPSVATYNEHLKPTMTEIELFHLFSRSAEFSQIVVRPEEKLELEMLMNKVPIPIRETVEDPSAKVNVLLQAYISHVRLEKFALACDMVYITQSAGRILRALFEIALLRGWSSLAQRCLNLCKMVSHQQWATQSPLHQFGKLPVSVLKKLDTKPIAFDRYFEMSAGDLEELVSGKGEQIHNIGKRLERMIHQIPRLSAEAIILPITRSMLSVELELRADFNYDPSIHGPSQGFHLIVEDGDGEQILYYQYWILKAKYANEEQYVNFTVPLFDPMPPQYFLRIISDTWLQGETTHLISFRSLILPEKFPPHTELLDLQPAPLSALHNPSFEAVLSDTLSVFNPIQTQVLRTVYESDANVLLAARNGSGKGVVGELAMFRLFETQPEAKVLYLCPVDAVCERKLERWSRIMGRIGKKVGKMIGDPKEDSLTLSRCDIIIAVPEYMDYFTCKGLHMKLIQQIRLVLIDNLHMIGSSQGYLLELVISRLRAFEAQAKADPSSRFSLQFRFVALSGCLANARSFAGWLNVDKGLFSFHSSVKVNPVQIRVQGFDINHAGTRLLAMSKPVYSTLTALSGGHAAVIFVPSRKQAQMTAIDILTFVSGTANPRRFNHIPEDQMEEVLSRVVDPALKTVLSVGVGFLFKGMNESDSQLVQELFTHDFIQVMVVTSEMCWELEWSVQLVIVMDTCLYDGKDHRYVDYPIVDLLEMAGFASRGGKYASGKVVVMTHVSKKAYLNKFLFEPLPVESTFHLHLNDALNAAITSRTVTSMRDAMEWLTWFFFYRRLPQNPNFYSLGGVSDEELNDFLSTLVENTAVDLQEAGAINIAEESLEPLNLGVLSTHLYIHVQSTELFARSITAKAKRRGLLQILCSSEEFSELPLRQHESLLLQRMGNHLQYVMENPTAIAQKVNVLLQSYFNRDSVPADLHRDTMWILPRAVRLLHGMVNVCSTNTWLRPAIAAIELCQMVVQAQWNEDSRLLQLPHFDKSRAAAFDGEGVSSIFDFLEMEDGTRQSLLSGLEEKEVEDVVRFCDAYPDIEVESKMDKEVKAGEDAVLRVELNTGEEEFHTQVNSRWYPQLMYQTWWLILGDPTNNTIESIVEVDLDRSHSKELVFTAPTTPGHYKWMLYFMTDAYIGCDQEQEIEFEVKEVK